MLLWAEFAATHDVTANQGAVGVACCAGFPSDRQSCQKPVVWQTGNQHRNSLLEDTFNYFKYLSIFHFSDL